MQSIAPADIFSNFTCKQIVQRIRLKVSVSHKGIKYQIKSTKYNLNLLLEERIERNPT